MADFPAIGRTFVDIAVPGIVTTFTLETDLHIFFLTGSANPLFVDGEFHWILRQQDLAGIDLPILEAEELAAVMVSLVCGFPPTE